MQSTTIRLPKFSIEKLSPVTMCSERNPGFSGGIWSEMSSVVLRLPEGRVAMVSTNKSGAYRMRDGKTFMDSEPYDCSTQAMVSKGNYNAADGRLLDPDEVPRYPYWKLNYYGAYDFYVANGVIHAFMHGENKNERLIVDGKVYEYRNSVKPDDTLYRKDEFAGYAEDGYYYDCGENYFAFIGRSSCRADDIFTPDIFNRNDRGPVVWPDCGYLNAEYRSVAMGVRHPSVFCHGGYVYVYYLEHTASSKCIKVIRSKTDDAGAPTAFYKFDGEDFTIPSTPFERPSDDRSVFQKGTAASPGLFASAFPCRFSVAALKGTPYFLGVCEEMDDEKHSHYLRLSSDLVHWGEPVEIEGVSSANWNVGVLHYPYLTDERFEKVMAVDPEDFYITGTYHDPDNGNLPTPEYLRLRLKLELE